MVEVGHAAARARRLENCVFVQADVGSLPHDSTAASISCTAASHTITFPSRPSAAASVLRCLRPGGVYCVIDPGPPWFNALSAPLGRLADPGWIGWKTPQEFRGLLEAAGFARTCWIPLLPGFGIAVGQKRETAPS
jgi:ubiquinone/menaquinone biosynthesis C-methylase UbiE